MGFGDLNSLGKTAQAIPGKLDAFNSQFDNYRPPSNGLDFSNFMNSIRGNQALGRSMGSPSAPGFDGSGVINPLGTVGGKVLYSGALPDRAFTGNADRPSYEFQRWQNPAWMSQNTNPYSYKDFNGMQQQGFTIDPKLMNDPNFNVVNDGSYRGQAQHTGLLGTGIVKKLANIAAVIPGPWQIPAAALSAGDAAQSSNRGELISALAPQIPVGGLAKGIQGFAPSLSSLGATSIARGVVGTGLGLVGGQNLPGALRTGVASGAGNYVGGKVADWTGNLGSEALTQGLSSASGGAVRGAINGGNVGMSALNGGLNGLAGGLGNDLSNNPNLTGWQRSLVGGIPQAGLTMYRNYRTRA
jgi:hypothetical protein